MLKQGYSKVVKLLGDTSVSPNNFFLNIYKKY